MRGGRKHFAHSKVMAWVAFDRAVRNDARLFVEEYDATAKRQMGNFPQAFSHLALINSAHNLTAVGGPAHKRAAGSSKTKGGAVSLADPDAVLPNSLIPALS